MNVDQRDNSARIGSIPLAPDKSPIGAPDEIEKRLLPEPLRPFLSLRQKSDELTRPNGALDLPTDADSGLVGLDTHEQGKAIDAAIPFEHVQFLFGGRRFQVRQKTAVSEIGRYVEAPRV